jgi:hypothetical protein
VTQAASVKSRWRERQQWEVVMAEVGAWVLSRSGQGWLKRTIEYSGGHRRWGSLEGAVWPRRKLCFSAGRSHGIGLPQAQWCIQKYRGCWDSQSLTQTCSLFKGLANQWRNGQGPGAQETHVLKPGNGRRTFPWESGSHPEFPVMPGQSQFQAYPWLPSHQ